MASGMNRISPRRFLAFVPSERFEATG